VGERLSAPLRISVRPVGLRVRRPSPSCAIVAFVTGCLRYSPGHSRGQGRGGSTKLFAVASFSRIAMRRTSETGAFLSAEDANSPQTFSVLEEPSPNRVDF
jgi:hypothetical protein